MENLENQNGNSTTGLDPNMKPSVINPNSHIDPVASNPTGLQERLSQQVGQTKKSGPKIWLILLIIFVLVLVGVGGWWYYAQGEAMLLARQIKWDWSQSLTNFKSDTNIDLTLSNIKQDSETVSLFSLPADIKVNISNVQHNAGKDLEGAGDYSIFLGGMGIDLSLDYKKIGETFYLKPKAESLDIPYLPIDTEFLSDRWIYFDNDGLEDVLSFNTNQDADNNEQIQQKNERLLADLQSKKIFTVKDPHESKDSPDGKLKKLQLVINPNIVEEAVRSAINIYSKDPAKDLAGLEKNIKESPEDWAKAKNFIANTKLMIWVNTKTKVVQGMEVIMDKLEYSSPDYSMTIDGSMSFLVAAEEPIVISTPLNAVTFDELLQEYQDVKEKEALAKMGAEFGFSDPSADDDNDGLANFEETFYGTDPQNKDSDNDSYLDGGEIENGYNPIGEGTMDDYETQTLPLVEAKCLETGGDWQWLEEYEGYDCQCPFPKFFNGMQGCMEF